MGKVLQMETHPGLSARGLGASVIMAASIAGGENQLGRDPAGGKALSGQIVPHTQQQGFPRGFGCSLCTTGNFRQLHLITRTGGRVRV